MNHQKVRLGKTDLEITPLGVGAWAWGDQLFWGFGRNYGEAEIRAAFDVSVQAGIDFFDTAEIYGSGRSEKFLGKFLRDAGKPALIATKFFPLPWRWRQQSVVNALRRTLKRLQLERVDLYQIHWPFPPVPIERWVSGLADAVHAGLTRAVGASNYNSDQTRRAFDVLAQQNIPLASNQVKYSLLDRRVERNGLMQTCRELGVTVIAYSPIEQGLLTGKYSATHPPPGIRGFRYPRDYLARVEPLIQLLKQIGEAYGGKTPAQVALNWTICKGTVPIPGAKDARQARENAGALGWRLTESEVAALDAASDKTRR